MEGQQFRVHLLGTSFTLRTNEDEQYFSSLLRYVESKYENVRRNMGVDDPLRIAIISSILVSDELFKTKQEDSKAENLTQEMIDYIDKNL